MPTDNPQELAIYDIQPIPLFGISVPLWGWISIGVLILLVALLLRHYTRAQRNNLKGGSLHSQIATLERLSNSAINSGNTLAEIRAMLGEISLLARRILHAFGVIERPSLTGSQLRELALADPERENAEVLRALVEIEQLRFCAEVDQARAATALKSLASGLDIIERRVKTQRQLNL